MAGEKRKTLAPAKPLSGFQDMLPDQALAFHHAVNAITDVYRSYGYTPIDAPCIYPLATLAGGSEEIDKQLYRWEQGSKEVALRFDLTVPLARYVAANDQKLSYPFKRYHCGKVWRGESVQKNRGRYREFYQLDFDIVGTESPTADLECLLVIHDSLKALGLSEFTLRLNDRLILDGVLTELQISDKIDGVLRSIDKLDKIGQDGVSKELSERVGLEATTIESVLNFTTLCDGKDNKAALEALRAQYGQNDKVKRGLERVGFMLSTAEEVLGTDIVKFDPAIARGLSYYTGPVFETVLDKAADMGSICSGGRYDNLASSYMKRQLPGVGASVGLSRLLAAMERLGVDSVLKKTATPLVILCFGGVDPKFGAKLQRQARLAGIGAELYPQPPAGWGKGTSPKNLFKYASQKGFKCAVVIGADEVEKGIVTLKQLEKREQHDGISMDNWVDLAQSLIAD